MWIFILIIKSILLLGGEGIKGGCDMKRLLVSGLFVLLIVCISPVAAQHTEWFLQKTGTPDTVSPGETITYTIRWTKVEENDMYIFTNLTDTLDPHVVFVSATGSYTLNGGVVTWDPAEQWVDSTTVVGDTLTQTGHFTLVVRVKTGTPDGTIIHNYAEVGGFDGYFMWDSAGASEDTEVVVHGPHTEWFLQKTGTPAVVSPGGIIRYTIRWTKVEENDMYMNTNLTDSLDSHVVFAAASGSYTLAGNVVTWDPAEQGVDSTTVVGDTLTQKGHLTLSVKVRQDTPNGTRIHNYAEVGGFDGAGMWDQAGAHAYTTVVRPYRLPGCRTPPTDPDGDGIYEDLNGNGRLDFADIVLYFNQMTWIAAHEPIAAFDLNGNGRIDFADIVALFNEI